MFTKRTQQRTGPPFPADPEGSQEEDQRINEAKPNLRSLHRSGGPLGKSNE